jgi:hypothetical protein
MSSYAPNEQVAAPQKAALPRSEHSTDRPAATGIPAPVHYGHASLHQSPRSQSLLQMRQALDDGPRVQSQLALQRALNRRRASEAKEDERPEQEARSEPAQLAAMPGDADPLPAPVQRRPNATGLPDHLKAGVEQLSGLAMDDVRVHFNSPKPATVQAHAYAQGTDIHLGPGQERHLPHEAWHVVQQKQGRVKPTLQMKGVAINDDAGLEREADLMGRNAAAGGGRAMPLKQRSRQVAGGGGTLQAIMSVAEFEAATPASVFKPRDTVTQIDQTLGAYVLSRTVANAANLINVIQTYVGGQHDAGRIAVANQLLGRARAENLLLQQIGDANAFLVDGLIDQAGIGRLLQLVQLATDVTAAHAAVLPHLIQTIDPANINNINVSGIVAALTPANASYLAQLFPLAAPGYAGLIALHGLIAVSGAPHVPLLAAMITQSGSHANIPALTQIVNRHLHNASLAFDLTREAGGNAANFARLATEVPQFLQTAAPGAVPANTLAEVALYNQARNAAMRATVINALNTLHGHALVAHAQAQNHAHAGMLGNVMNRINAVQARINALNLAPAPAPADLTAARDASNIIGHALNIAVGVNATPAFTQAVQDVAAQVVIIANTNTMPIIASVDYDHFLTRHTAHHYAFNVIKPSNTLWDTSWAGNSNANVAARLNSVINGLAVAANWLQPNVPVPNQPVAGGGTAQIAAEANAAGNLIIGMFFPEHNPGQQIYDHPDTTIRAIQKVL